MKNDTTNITIEDAIKYLTKAIPRTSPNINLMPTTANESRSIINSPKSKNSCGYDEISATLLKSYTDYISAPLNYFCNQSMAEGIFPEVSQKLNSYIKKVKNLAYLIIDQFHY